MRSGSAAVKQGRATAQRVLSTLVELRAANGYPPSLREIAEQIGVCRRTVHEAMVRLEDAGAIRSTPNAARSWVPLRTEAYPEASE